MTVYLKVKTYRYERLDLYYIFITEYVSTPRIPVLVLKMYTWFKVWV